MSAKHTPGPWTARTQRVMRAVTIEAAGRIPICVTTGSVSKAEHEANARLIAAAPELHNLARAARDYLSGIPETAAGGDDEAVKLTRDLSALLARIEGEG